MTRLRPPISRTSLLFLGAGALILASGCSAFRKDTAEKRSTTYEAPELDTIEEAPPIPYSEVYVPVDSHAYQKDGKKLPLLATLVLRNPNRSGSLIVKKVDLYGQDGKRIRRVTEEAFELRPFSSVEFLATAEEDQSPHRSRDEDEALDPGAEEGRTWRPRNATPSHFIVQWGTTDGATAPLVETVMVDSEGTILYARPGHEIGKIPATRPEMPKSHAPRVSHDVRNDAVPTRPVHASVAPQYELVRYDSNMGLGRKDPQTVY